MLEAIFLPDDEPQKKRLASWARITSDKARLEFYDHGVRVRFATMKAEGGFGERGEIMDMSAASRREAAFVFGNASNGGRKLRWVAMSVLTFRLPPDADTISRAMDRLRRAWRARWGEGMDAWIMEFQARGAVHFHLFHCDDSNFGAACAAARTEVVVRKGRTRRLVRGGPDYWLVSAWLSAMDDPHPDTISFNQGGIIELLDSPDAAGRYVAKECAKRFQKKLPAEWEEGVGRWWYLNRKWRPQIRGIGEADLSKWPFEAPYSRIWEAEKIAGAVAWREDVTSGDAACDAKFVRCQAARAASRASLPQRPQSRPPQPPAGL